MERSQEDRTTALAALIEARAVGLARDGRLDAAEEALRELVAKLPDRAQPRLLLARVLGQQGRYADALAAIQGIGEIDAQRLRERLKMLSARGSMPVRPLRLVAIGAGFLLGVILLGGSLYAWLSTSRADLSEAPARVADLVETSPTADLGIATVELLTSWSRLARDLETLPSFQRVHLRPEFRKGSVVAVLEGDVVSRSVAARIGHSASLSGLDVDLSGLDVADSYPVVAGDSLSRIALRAYGDSARWPAIWEANRNAVPDPDRIAPGTTLFVP